MTDSNRKTGSSVKGTTKYGVKLCQRLTKVGKLKDRGYMDLGYLEFMNNVSMKKEWMPQPRATCVSLP
jgi:hypothetical protein